LSLVLGWTALGLLLVVGVPLFLCMGLSADVAEDALLAQALRHGNVWGRDLVLPGHSPIMGLLLAAPLRLWGWSVAGLRALDLAVIGGIIVLLTRWLRLVGASGAIQVWTAVALLAWYLSSAESCQCRPELWALLPAMAALLLRAGQVARLVRPEAVLGRLLPGALVEGLCWGLAGLLQPVALLAALLCWLLTLVVVWRQTPQALGRLAADAIGVLMGVGAIGGLWVAWLRWQGSWPLEGADLSAWGLGSLHVSADWQNQLEALLGLWWPWGLAQVVAVPLAVAAVWNVLRGSTRRGKSGLAVASVAQGLLGCLVLSWFVQANVLQAQQLHQLAPVLVLAVALLAGQPVHWLQVAGGRWWVVRTTVGRFALPAPLAWVLLYGGVVYLGSTHPLCAKERLALWPRCWREGSSPALRDELTLSPTDDSISWTALAEVAAFLRKEQLGPGELTCSGQDGLFLYLELDRTPSTRFACLSDAMACFPAEQVREALNASRQRWVVSDWRAIGLNDAELWGQGVQRRPPPAFWAKFPRQWLGVFPWSEPVAFGNGPYVVHRVTGPVKRLEPAASSTESPPR
jgi:hypothetical protein